MPAQQEIRLTSKATAALRRLARSGMFLCVDGRGGYAVTSGHDLRRRATARVSVAEARAMISEGVLDADPHGRPDTWQISAAGRSHLQRQQPRGDAAEVILDDSGQPMTAQSPAIRRLRGLLSPDGRPWFSMAHVEAARRIERDHRLASLGVRLTADWSALPVDRSRRGGATDDGSSAGFDAREKLAVLRRQLGSDMFGLLADYLYAEQGFEEIERRRQWPSRSAKVALRLALGLADEARR